MTEDGPKAEFEGSKQLGKWRTRDATDSRAMHGPSPDPQNVQGDPDKDAYRLRLQSLG
jgi:hypothetical protein